MSQFPTPALREWAANPLSPEMRETFLAHSSVRWSKKSENNKEASGTENFEKYLMGYTIRDPRYCYIEWRDTRSNADALYQELYDHQEAHMKQSISHTQSKVAWLSGKLQHP